MEIRGQEIIGSGLIGEVKSNEKYPDMSLVEEVKKIMEKYKIDWMWFGWSKFGSEEKQNQA